MPPAHVLMTHPSTDSKSRYALLRPRPAVAGNDLAVVADQHRVGEAEARDAGGNLLDLFLRVRPGIAGI